MSQPGSPPESEQPEAAVDTASSPGHASTKERVSAAEGSPRPALLWVGLIFAVIFGSWGLWRTLGPGASDVHARLTASEQANRQLQKRMDEMQQTIVTLGRSDQISRDANRDLQSALAEREEEIAGVRADVAFYERLVGATSQRRGLTVHALRMSRQNEKAWEFQTTLTQNLNRGAVSAGRLSLSIEGTMDGKRRELAWDDLRQGEKSDGTPFSFKYFQQVKGDVFLPEGFSPVRVTLTLQPRSGPAISESFSWSEVTDASGQGGGASVVGD